MDLRTSINKFHLTFIRLVLVCFVPFLLHGCLTSGSQTASHSQYQKKTVAVGPKISVFLNLKNFSGPAITMKVSSVDVLAGDLWVPLVSDSFEVNSKSIGPGQLFIGRSVVPTGRYDKIRFVIEEASLRQNGVSQILSVQQPHVEIRFPDELQIADHDSKTIVVSFDTKNSVGRTGEFIPALDIAPQRDPFVADLAYVSCPLLNTIYLVRTDKNWVTGSIGVSGRPTYISVDRFRNRLYVLSEDESAIKVIEISSNRILDRIQIPLLSDPGFMTLSSDGLSAYIIDNAGQNILRINISTGSLAARVRSGEKPEYIVEMPDHNLLAVSSGISNEVLLLDSENLASRGVIPVGSSPQGMLAKDNLLYIAEYDSDTVTVYDLYNRNVRRRITVGYSPKRLVDSDTKIYVSHPDKQLVSVINSSLLNVSKEIVFAGAPSEMAYSEKRRWLYVGDARNGRIAIIDTTSNRIEEHIELDTVPLSLAIVQ